MLLVDGDLVRPSRGTPLEPDLSHQKILALRFPGGATMCLAPPAHDTVEEIARAGGDRGGVCAPVASCSAVR